MATTNATAPKGAPAVKKQSQGFTGIKSGFIVIILCFVIAELLYFFGAGHASNFKGDIGAQFVVLSDAEAFEPDGLIGTVYMGGFVVPLIWGLFLTVFASLSSASSLSATLTAAPVLQSLLLTSRRLSSRMTLPRLRPSATSSVVPWPMLLALL